MGPDLESQRHALTLVGSAALSNFLAAGARLVFDRPDAPLVSVLIAAYNRAELTFGCLLSLRGSSLPIEIVLIDNGSTDATASLLERLDGVTVVRNPENRGFLLAANQAARLARGRDLLFLNNDCEMLPGSLESAVGVLHRDEVIGAVGGKLIRLDGRLQEAGCSIGTDGMCTGYGRGAEPTAPPYMFERDVDYCSGAFLLTPRETFLGHGGFDEAFGPAYYEDADYCLRLWQAGRRVVYDPRAVALHVEFASSRSIADALAQQAERRRVFVDKHGASLRARRSLTAERNFAGHHRSLVGRRVLFVDDRVPHPELGSGYPRALSMIESLVRAGHAVTHYPLLFPTEDWASVYASVPRGVEVMVGYGLARFDEFRRERADFYETVIVSRHGTLRALQRQLGEERPFGATPTLYDLEAILFLSDSTRRRLAGEVLEEEDVERRIAEEVVTGADVVIAVSQAEADRVRRAGVPKVAVVGHAVPVAPSSASFAAREGLLFVGAVSHESSPNADALAWLGSEIMPRVRARLSLPVGLTVAGVGSSTHGPTGPGVSCLGPVADLAPLYERARLFVAPVRFGAGMPMKVHHAAAHGLPIVCTSLLAAQVGWKDGVELLVADDADAFAARCVELYSDPDLWERVRRNALTRVQQDCGQASFDAALREALALAGGEPKRSCGEASFPSALDRTGPPAARSSGERCAAAVALPARLPDDRADRIALLDAALRDARNEVAALRDSYSWRVTAPLRALHAWLARRRF